MQKKMDGGTEKNRAKGLVTAPGGMLGEALEIITSANTTHPNDRQVVFESTLGFSSVLNRVWHPEKGTSLNKIFPVALFKKS